MKIFITADHHFHHKNIIEYCGRPFKTVEEMDKVLIEKWNNKVSKNDLVIHLGDFALGTKEKVKETRDSREDRGFSTKRLRKRTRNNPNKEFKRF